MARHGRTFPIRAHINYQGRAGIYFNRSLSSIFSETVVVVDSVTRTIGRSLLEVTIINDLVAFSKISFLSLIDSMIVNDSLGMVRTASIITNEVVTITDSIVRTIDRFIVETVAIFDTLSKESGKVFSEVITILDTTGVTRIANLILEQVISVVDLTVGFTKRARDFIMGRNNDTNIKVGKSI